MTKENTNSNEKNPLREEIDSLKSEIDQLKSGKSSIIICNNCGAENISSSKFCTTCGSVLDNQTNEKTLQNITYGNKDRLAKKVFNEDINKERLISTLLYKQIDIIDNIASPAPILSSAFLENASVK